MRQHPLAPNIWKRNIVLYPIPFCISWGPEPALPTKLVSQELENTEWCFLLAAKDIPSMMNEVKFLLLLAKVYKSHKKEDVLETLNKVIKK